MTKVFMNNKTGDLYAAHECAVLTDEKDECLGVMPGNWRISLREISGYIVEFQQHGMPYAVFFNMNCFKIFSDLGAL